MIISNFNRAKKWFEVLQTLSKTQVATMRLRSRQSFQRDKGQRASSERSGVDCRVEGEVYAEIGDEKATLRQGDVVTVLRPACRTAFVNHGGSDALTVNVYSPGGVLRDACVVVEQSRSHQVVQRTARTGAAPQSRAAGESGAAISAKLSN